MNFRRPPPKTAFGAMKFASIFGVDDDACDSSGLGTTETFGSELARCVRLSREDLRIFLEANSNQVNRTPFVFVNKQLLFQSQRSQSRSEVR